MLNIDEEYSFLQDSNQTNLPSDDQQDNMGPADVRSESVNKTRTNDITGPEELAKFD